MTAEKIQALRLAPEPLPATVEDMLARKTMREMNLNDHVDLVHVELYRASKDYRKLLDAVYNSDAVEGSIRTDSTLAAIMIRDYAKAHELHYLIGKNLRTIELALNVIMRRYHMGRRERKRTVAGAPE